MCDSMNYRNEQVRVDEIRRVIVCKLYLTCWCKRICTCACPIYYTIWVKIRYKGFVQKATKLS
jgi:hypothetical protein